jgi:hypothetical protein
MKTFFAPISKYLNSRISGWQSSPVLGLVSQLERGAKNRIVSADWLELLDEAIQELGHTKLDS